MVFPWASLQRAIRLSKVFFLDDNAARAGSLGLMEVIKAAMERHASSEQVSEAGLGALRTICFNGICADLNRL